jgi:hypothetical protein
MSLNGRVFGQRRARASAAADRARRIGSPRARATLAGRIDALVARSRRGAPAERFQTGLVRVHADRLRVIAERVRAADAPASGLAA